MAMSEEKSTDEVVAINALTEWGKAHMITPNLARYLDDLREDFSLLTGENQAALLEKVVCDTKASVDSAKETLSNPELVTATEEDDLWHKAEEAFLTLDRINFLVEALLYCPHAGQDGWKGALEKADAIAMDILNWFEAESISPLRWIGLNHFRKAYLERIPEEKRYLFFWYESYCNYPENTLEILMENYDKFERGDADFFPAELQSEIGMISHELRRDEKLSSIIRREFALHKGLRNALSKRSSLTLWYLSDKWESETVLPKAVEDAGLIKMANRMLVNAFKNVSNEADKLYWAFLAAFCGSTLSTKQQLELFDWVEEEINDIDLSRTGNFYGIENLLTSLKKWYQDRGVQDAELITRCASAWEYNLVYSTELPMTSQEEEDTDPGTIWRTLEKIRNESLWSKLMRWLRSLSYVYKTRRYAMVMMGGAEGQDNDIQIERNIIEIYQRPSRDGKYHFLLAPPSNLLLGKPRDYEQLYNAINRNLRANWLWAGWGISEEAQGPKALGPSGRIENIDFYQLADNSYQRIIIAISKDEKSLNNFCDLIVDVQSPKNENRIDGVIVLVTYLQRN